MANIYKNVQKLLNAAGSDVDMYESPTATASLIKTVKLFNTHSGALDVTVKVFDASSSTDFEYKVASINANEGAPVPLDDVKRFFMQHIDALGC